MGFIKHNPNEAMYVEGKKHFRDVIKNTGPLDAFIYREPEEDFNTHSTLIVEPGETAVFVHNGVIQDVIQGGRQPLKTENLPFVSRLRTNFTGGISSFNCYVIFIKTTSTQQLEWGDRVAARDPVQKIQTDLGVSGSYRVRVTDPRLLINDLFGARIDAVQESSLQNYFSSEMKKHIKSNIVRAINQSGVEILGIEANLDVFSDVLRQILAPLLQQYGIELISFSIDRMMIMDSEVRARLEADFGRNRSMEYMGENWARDQIAQALQTIASNPNSGGMANAGMGFGMGMAAMPMFNSMLQQLSPSASNMVDAMTRNAQSASNPSTPPTSGQDSIYRQKKTPAPSAESQPQTAGCPACGKMNDQGSRFCSSCGAPLAQETLCPQCGSKLATGSRFCSFCGQKL